MGIKGPTDASNQINQLYKIDMPKAARTAVTASSIALTAVAALAIAAVVTATVLFAPLTIAALVTITASAGVVLIAAITTAIALNLKNKQDSDTGPSSSKLSKFLPTQNEGGVGEIPNEKTPKQIKKEKFDEYFRLRNIDTICEINDIGNRNNKTVTEIPRAEVVDVETVYDDEQVESLLSSPSSSLNNSMQTLNAGLKQRVESFLKKETQEKVPFLSVRELKEILPEMPASPAAKSSALSLLGERSMSANDQELGLVDIAKGLTNLLGTIQLEIGSEQTGILREREVSMNGFSLKLGLDGALTLNNPNGDLMEVQLTKIDTMKLDVLIDILAKSSKHTQTIENSGNQAMLEDQKPLANLNAMDVVLQHTENTNASIAMQSLARMSAASKALSNKKTATVKIQSLVRMNKAKATLSELRVEAKAATTIESLARMSAASKALSNKKTATVKIQSLVRMNKAKAILSELRVEAKAARKSRKEAKAARIAEKQARKEAKAARIAERKANKGKEMANLDRLALESGVKVNKRKKRK